MFGPAIIRPKNTGTRPVRLKMAISPSFSNISTFLRCAFSLALS